MTPSHTNSAQKVETGGLVRAAQNSWPAILISQGVGAEFLINRHGPCPGCGGRDRFRFDDRDGRGSWVCGGGGEMRTGDGFDLLMHVHGWSQRESFQAVSSWLGMAGNTPLQPRPQRPLAPPIPIQTRTAAYARDLWARADRESVPGHPYALAKRIWWPAGAGRVVASGKLIGRDADCIVVPIRNTDEKLVAVECLSEHRDPAGKFLRQTFGPKREGWLVLGNDLDPGIPRYCCEGWATGAKLMEFMGNCCVYVAFGIGRLQAVAAEVERRWPGSTVAICAEAAHA